MAGDRQGAGAFVSYSGRIAGGDRAVAVGAVPVTNIDDRIGILAGLLKVDGTVDHGRRSPERAGFAQISDGGEIERGNAVRSAKRRVGNECVSTCRYRGSLYHQKKTQ